MLIFWPYGKLKDVPVLKIWRYLSFWVDFRVSGGGAVKGITKITFYGYNLGGYGMAARIPYEKGKEIG